MIVEQHADVPLLLKGKLEAVLPARRRSIDGSGVRPQILRDGLLRLAVFAVEEREKCRDGACALKSMPTYHSCSGAGVRQYFRLDGHRSMALDYDQILLDGPFGLAVSAVGEGCRSGD